MPRTLRRAASAAALALALGAGASAQDPSGVVGAGYSKLDIDDGDQRDTYSIAGSYFNGLGGGLNLQADAAYGHSEVDDTDAEADELFGQLHLFARDSDRYAFGGFAGVMHVDADSDEEATAWGLGGEGEIYRESWTLGGVAGWIDLSDLAFFDSAWGGCGYARLYGSDNFLIEGRASVANTELDLGPVDTDVDSYGYGAGVEYMFAGSGFSIGASVDRAESDEVFNVTNAEATRFGIGGKLSFGSRTLKERDRRGAGLQGVGCVSRALPF